MTDGLSSYQKNQTKTFPSLKPLLVLSAGRTGTTLLMQLLGTAPQIVFDRVYPYEVRYLTYLLRWAQMLEQELGQDGNRNDAANLAPPSQNLGPFPYEKAQLWNGQEMWPACFAAAWNKFSALAIARMQGSMMTEIQPRYYAEKITMWMLPFLQRAIACNIILLVRDPRDIFLSISAFDKKRGFPGFSRRADDDDLTFAKRLIIDWQGGFNNQAFTEKWLEGYHIVWGVRGKRDDPWSKTFLANIFYRLVRRLALADLPEHGMDCGLFDRKVVDVFREIRDQNSITFMTVYWMGFNQAQVPYHRHARQFGLSKWPVGKRVKSALDVITSFSYLPLRLSSYVGLFISCIAFLGAIAILFNKLVLNIGEWGWPSLMVTMLFLSGTQLLVIGILGEYLWRIGSEVRGRPQYIVMEEFGFDKQGRYRRPGVSGSSIESREATDTQSSAATQVHK